MSADALSKAELDFKQKFETALVGTDCCVLAQSAANADVVIKAAAHDENNRAAFVAAFITGFSLYTIPSWATSHVHFTATANKSDASAKAFGTT